MSRKPTWKPAMVDIRGRWIPDGAKFTVRVQGYVNRACPGLVVTPGVGMKLGTWSITHTRSGYRLPGLFFKTPKEAQEVAWWIAALIDWDRPQKAIWDHCKSVRAKQHRRKK